MGDACDLDPVEAVVLTFDTDPDGGAIPGGTIIDSQWSSIGVDVECGNNTPGNPDECVVLDSNSLPAGQNDLGTHCQTNTLIVATNVDDGNGDGRVDTPYSEPGGGQIRFNFSDPVDLAGRSRSWISTRTKAERAVMAIIDAGGGTIVVPVPVLGNGTVQTVTIDVPYVTELTVAFDQGWRTGCTTYTPTVIPQVAAATMMAADADVCVDSVYPVADAGDDREIVLGAVVHIDGSNSHKGDPWIPDNVGLEYQWSVKDPFGNPVELQDAGSPVPSFIPGQDGVYDVTLTVRRLDNAHESWPDQVRLTTTWNLYDTLLIDPPSIDFGDVHIGESAGIGLMLTDACVDNGNCETLSVDPAVTTTPVAGQFVSDAVEALPHDGAATELVVTFAPTELGNAQGQVAIRDSAGVAALVYLTGTGFNLAPIAHAGDDQALLTFATVRLDGSLSGDPDGDAIEYDWTLLSKPAGSAAELADAHTVAPTFIADVYGDYVASLSVTDMWGQESPMADSVTISFANAAPNADAGEAFAVFVGEDALLDGSGSFDPNGDLMTYAWSFDGKPAGSEAILIGDNEQMAHFLADVAGTYLVRLTVSDNLESDQATVQIQAVETLDAITQSLSAANTALNALDDEDFRFKRARAFLTAKINHALNSMDKGQPRVALVMLERTVLRRMDGCALRGIPDERAGVDTIVNCSAQAQVYPHVLNAVVLLRDIVDNQ